MSLRWAAVLVMLLFCSCAHAVRKPELEIRGVWVATVNNIDWPSRRDLTPEQQRAELIAIFDRAASLGLNAVFLQVRPAADAIYPAESSPWTEYLTGVSGKAPDPAYDPLAFAVEEAHRRGLQLHAWFNPFRARHPTAGSPPAAPHVSVRRADLVREYGRHLWLDPGDPDAQREVIAAVADVVQRYAVDGVHLDDYFYPYPENDLPFPDDATWQQHGGALSRDDWRRDNINRFVRTLYLAVKSIRSDVLVGISPFGIWRPGHPEQIRGFDAYDRLYADSRLWLQEGWVDYLAPQLYWPIEQREQSFSALLEWWLEQDTLRRGVVPGLSISRVANGRPNALTAEQIRRQIELTETSGGRGFILFSARALMDDRGGINAAIREALRTAPRARP